MHDSQTPTPDPARVVQTIVDQIRRHDYPTGVLGLGDAHAALLLEHLDELPAVPLIVALFRNVGALTQAAWQRNGGASFFTRTVQQHVSPYHIALMVQELKDHHAWHRAHNDLVTTYLTHVLEGGSLSAEVFAEICHVNDFNGLDATYLACLDQAFAHQVNNLERMLTINAKRPSVNNSAVIDDLNQRLATATVRRDELFHNRWLPALISATEYARIKDLPTGYLKHLYATHYAGGYTLYHEHMVATNQ